MESVTIELKDIVLMVGLFGTAFGIGGAWIDLRRDVRDVKKIVTNGLSDKVSRIEEDLSEVKLRMDYLPCRREVQVRHHRHDDPQSVDLEEIRRQRACEELG